MPAPRYERLSATSRALLIRESQQRPLHVVTLHLLEGSVDPGALDARIAWAIQALPRYRQRIVRVPLEQQPVWVDDPRFGLSAHVRHTTLPAPGDHRALERLLSSIAGRPLDPARPLWELWMVDGLADGRFALISKVHACAAEGGDLCEHLFSSEPTGSHRGLRGGAPPPSPSPLSLWRAELERRLGLPALALSDPEVLVRELQDWQNDAFAHASVAADVIEEMRGGISAPNPFEGRPGARRAVAWQRFELGPVEASAAIFGCSVADIAVVATSHALRAWVERRGLDPRLQAAAALACNADGLGGLPVTQLLDLPLFEPNPRRALRHLAPKTRSLLSRARAWAIPPTGWTPPERMSDAARALAQGPEAAVCLATTPAPQRSVPLLDATLRDAHVLLPVQRGGALAVSSLSYAGHLCWALNADADLVPDLDRLAADIEDTCIALRKLAHLVAAAEAHEARRDRRGRRSGRDGPAAFASD